MLDTQISKNTIREIIICCLIVGFINLIFFYLTKDNAWVSDDYRYVYSPKLFNLINEQLFYFQESFLFQENRFIPFYWLSHQFIPNSHTVWHAVVIFLFFYLQL